jgi:hypothetical protein
MIKHAAVGFLDGVNPIDADRWYFRYHSKECIRFFGPWLRRYETYRALTPPGDARQFGLRGGRYTELWYDSRESYIEARPNDRPYTRPSFPGTASPPPRAASLIVSAMPTDDFLGKEPTPEATHILRWICVFKYPEGVSLQDGEKWFLETHSREMKQQPGLLRYVSHRVIENSPLNTPWVRLAELWYEDFSTWHKANIESPVRYTPPPWGGTAPFVDMASTFVGYKPDVDFLRDNPIIP